MKKLEKGQLAPRIDRTSIFDRLVNTDKMMDGKLWIAFYRYSSCPMCDMHFDDVVSNFNELQKRDIKFIAVFESEVENFPSRIRNLSGRYFNVIADRNKFLYEAYRIEASWPKVFHPGTLKQGVRAHLKGYRPGKIDGDLARIPAHFLVYKGLIYLPHYGRHAGHHIPWQKVMEFGDKKIREQGIELTAE